MAERITDTIAVLGTLSDIYQIWAKFESFPHFMKNIKSVVRTDNQSSDWVMVGPGDQEYAWQADITSLEEDRRVAWRSQPGSEVLMEGEAEFEKLGPNKTRVTVTMVYEAAEQAGSTLSALLRNPAGRVREDLQRFKDYVESTTDRMRETPDDGGG